MMGAIGFEVLFGSLTITGSLMAFAKLQELVPGPAHHLPLPERLEHRPVLRGTLAMFVFLVFVPAHAAVFLRDDRVGTGDRRADGHAHRRGRHAGGHLAAELLRRAWPPRPPGFVINNNVLIIAGALDGASGFFLSILMSRAMNRSFANVLFGAVGAVPAEAHAAAEARRPSSATRPKTPLHARQRPAR